MNLFCNNQFYNKESLLPTTDTILCLIIAHTRGQIQHWSAIHHKEAFIKIYASLQTDRMLFRTQIGRDYNMSAFFLVQSIRVRVCGACYQGWCLWGLEYYQGHCLQDRQKQTDRTDISNAPLLECNRLLVPLARTQDNHEFDS